MRLNWSNIAQNAKLAQKKIKTLQAASEYLSDIPPEGYFKDNISKKVVKIDECRSSSLRRYAKVLDNYYYLVSAESSKKLIAKKQVEIQNELARRSDALNKNNDD